MPRCWPWRHTPPSHPHSHPQVVHKYLNPGGAVHGTAVSSGARWKGASTPDVFLEAAEAYASGDSELPTPLHKVGAPAGSACWPCSWRSCGQGGRLYARIARGRRQQCEAASKANWL